MGVSDAAVINGRLYVPAGVNASGSVNTLFIYDPVTDSWTTGASAPFRGAGGAAVVDEKMFIPGGGTNTAEHGRCLRSSNRYLDNRGAHANSTPRSWSGERSDCQEG